MKRTADDALPHCPATRKDGTPCQGKPTNSGFCVAHDPRALSWRIIGGHSRRNANRAEKLLPSRLQPVVKMLEQAFQELYDGERTPQSATALATVAMSIGRLIQTGELEERTRQLEKMAKETATKKEKWA